MQPVATLDYTQFDALTFDVYGTLIDWETGLLEAFRPVLSAHGVQAEEEDLLARYAGHEAAAEAGPYQRYRDLLAAGLRGVGEELGFEPADDELARFGGSVVDWPAFPDAVEGLARLRQRFGLGVITNCDDDLFEASNARLGRPFTWVVTAEQVGAYKPDPRNLRTVLERVGLPQERVLHVAQSLYHDHGPAGRIGLRSVWIDRRHDRPGSGATPVAEAHPDATFPDLASFVEAVLGP